MAEKPDQDDPEPTNNEIISNPNGSGNDSVVKGQSGQSQAASIEMKSTPPQDDTQIPKNQYLDEYVEIHNQLTKFKQKPLIRMAAWIDRHISEGGLLDRTLHNLMASLSILKNQGLKALLHRIESKSRHAHKGKYSRNTIQLDALNSTEYYELTPEFSEAILKRVAAEPPVKPDIIIFPFIDWEFRIQRPQHLAIQLAESGHRVFYVQAR